MRLEDYAAVKQALDGLHRELMHLNASAARSLAEGLDETLTVHRLHVPQQLREYAANFGGAARPRIKRARLAVAVLEHPHITRATTLK